ncbi:MAG: hypothetical protein RI554_11680, partial [Trueperaceae bacterium]|nr:hypothetical protein [Trueperaceae bacterium]
MPDLVNTNSLTWSESAGDLLGTVTGRVPSVRVDDNGTVGSNSTPGALTIDAAGNVTLSADA